jgi:hypothetical protein
MTGAETLKGVDVLQDMLQDIYKRMKDISLNSAQITVQLVIFAINTFFMVRYQDHGNSENK